MTTALPTAPSAYGLNGPSAAVTVDNATPQGSTYPEFFIKAGESRLTH